MITLTKAKESIIGKKIKEAKLRLVYPNNSNLSHFVLEEQKNPNSKWNTYFKMLPQDLSSFPIFYTKSERKLLKNTVFDEDIDELISDMIKDYDTICKAAPEFKKHKFHDFMKTRALVNSRIFGVKINNVQDDSIVPLADMFNYSHVSNHSQWSFNSTLNGFEVKAKQDIPRGEPIYEGYGLKHNANYLMFYGFVVENNVSNKTKFTIKIAKDDPLLNYKS